MIGRFFGLNSIGTNHMEKGLHKYQSLNSLDKFARPSLILSRWSEVARVRASDLGSYTVGRENKRTKKTTMLLSVKNSGGAGYQGPMKIEL